MFKIKCSCGELLQSQNSLVGKVIRCKNCERAIKIEEGPGGSTRAVALAPEVSLPEFVKSACESMRLGNLTVQDKICLECGASNSIERAACSVCGNAWTMDEANEAAVSMDVTDDARNETEEDEDLTKYAAVRPESSEQESSSSEIDEVVKNAGEFQLVGDDSVGETPEEPDPENPEATDAPGQEDMFEGPRAPERRPISRRFRPHSKGSHGFKKRRPFK